MIWYTSNASCIATYLVEGIRYSECRRSCCCLSWYHPRAHQSLFQSSFLSLLCQSSRLRSHQILQSTMFTFCFLFFFLFLPLLCQREPKFVRSLFSVSLLVSIQHQKSLQNPNEISLSLTPLPPLPPLC